MADIKLPLESLITIRKNGETTVKHTAMVTGGVTKELAELCVRMAGGSVEELINGVQNKTPQE